MKPTATYETHSEEETIALGRRIGSALPEQAVVLLTGNLGAGKTTLTKGIVEALGAAPRDEVSSPTFTLIHEYGPRVFHVDLYRLDSEREVATLGLEELFDRSGITLIEWGERFPRLMPARRTEIRIEHAGGDSRRITITEIPDARNP